MALVLHGKPVDMEKELLRPYTHIMPARSNQLLEEEFLNACQYWLKIPKGKFEAIKDFMIMFCNCTHLFDDMQDNSLYRRHLPTSHCVYGIPLTVNACLHVVGLCMEKIMELGHPQAMDIFATQYLKILRGQGTDCWWREMLVCPTEEEFKKTGENKSSAMFVLPMRLMQLFSDNKKDYTKLLNMFGVYYILRDDYCNLVKPGSLEGRDRNIESTCIDENRFCEDLTDGKLSWPVIYALRNSAEAHTLIYMIKQRTRDMGMKQHYLRILEQCGSLQYCRTLLREYDQMMREELARHGSNPIFEKILDNFKDWDE